MEVIRGLHNLRARHSGCVVTIGNFDGIHLGHQSVLGELAEKAAEMDLSSLVMVFEPHPQEFFDAENAPARLTRFREKVQILRRFAVDRLLCVRFDKKFASIPAQDFVQQILIEKLGVRHLIIGDDFRFGHGRSGDVEMLRAAGETEDFQVMNMRTFDMDGERVSSTRIRAALKIGELNVAEKLLGRSYRMSGRVVQGDQRGRTIGFPTANIYLHRKVSPITGVFAVQVFGLDDEPLQAVANIGTRPTVDGKKCLLEVHLLDFDQDIYGRHVQVMFLRKLREEQRFESLDDLKQQIHCDVQAARDIFEQQ